MSRARVFVISAPSGCGKTTLLKRLLRDRDLGLTHSVSMTTRRRRKGERDGVDYYFVSDEEFKNAVAAGRLLEREENFGHLYGTPKAFVADALQKGKDLLLNIDVRGAMIVKKKYLDRCVLILLVPPSLKALKERLLRRKTDDYGGILGRLRIARRELACKDRFDYVVVNRTIDAAHRRLREIVLSEKGAA